MPDQQTALRCNCATAAAPTEQASAREAHEETGASTRAAVEGDVSEAQTEDQGAAAGRVKSDTADLRPAAAALQYQVPG